jgi:acetylornithine deacetylase/succinyl-diaminopimelate desuccinylase-like protein
MPPQLEELGFPAEFLASGAGHNAVPTAALADLAMLFVRCKGGISHNPAESVTISGARRLSPDPGIGAGHRSRGRGGRQ